MIVCAPWATVDQVKDGPAACASCSDVDDALLEQMLMVASDLLFELTGHLFSGECDATVRPCARRIADDGPSRGVTTRSTASGMAVSMGCGCGSPRSCGCSRLSEITLGGWPVTEVTEVLVDGAILDPSRYRIDDSRFLVRLPDADGSRPGWPCCQDMALDSTEPDTFEVSFKYGQVPPPAGVIAVSALACELALACTPGGECKLPSGIRSQVRQGVATEYLTPSDLLDNGVVGIREVDLFLQAYGPKQRKARLSSQVINPDIHRAVRRTEPQTYS